MEIQLLMDNLRKVLKLKGISFAQLAKSLGISERSLTRTFSGKGLSVERLIKICDISGVSLHELTKIGEVGLERSNFMFTEEQEEFMANNFEYHLFYNFLWTHDSVKSLAKNYNIDDVTIGKLLSSLEKIGLLEWLPENEVKLFEPRKFNNPYGPLFKIHGNWLAKKLVEKSLASESDPGILFFPNLSKNAVAKFKVKMKELAKEIKKEREIESLLKISTETEPVGVLFCIEPTPNFDEPLKDLRL